MTTPAPVAYYNEPDPHAADWLEHLIEEDLIALGEVDRRKIEDVVASDLRGYTQCHFFAGIGVWSYAARLAGIRDSEPIWTGSCPCQPFSNAGAKKGQDDDRHLWPYWYSLILQCRPAVVFGEQVGSPLGRDWLDHVLADLEDVGFAVGAADLPAASVGAPHIRQRLWFGAVDGERMADDDGDGWGRFGAARVHGRRPPAVRDEAVAREAHRQQRDDAVRRGEDGDAARRGEDGGVADDLSDGRGPGAPRGRDEGASAGRGRADDGTGHATGSRRQGRVQRTGVGESVAGARGDVDRLGIAGGNRTRQHGGQLCGDEAQHAFGIADGVHPPLPAGAADSLGSTRGHWAGAEWVYCRDGVYRPLEPGLVALVDGVAFRLPDGSPPVREVSRPQILRALGNAIVPQVAATFIASFLGAVHDAQT